MEQNYITGISSIYIKTFSFYKMLFIKHSKYGPADEVIELLNLSHMLQMKDQSSLRIRTVLKLLSEKTNQWVHVRTVIREAVLMSTHNKFLSRNKKNNVYPVNFIFTI